VGLVDASIREATHPWACASGASATDRATPNVTADNATSQVRLAVMDNSSSWFMRLSCLSCAAGVRQCKVRTSKEAMTVNPKSLIPHEAWRSAGRSMHGPYAGES